MAMDAFAKARDDKYPQISKKLACALGKPQYALQLSAGYPQGHLHHKRNLIPELRDPCRD
ncbi:transposase [Salmonella sp. NCTC 11881]|nr:transposase [Salmonella sp. NCTC 11881]